MRNKIKRLLYKLTGDSEFLPLPLKTCPWCEGRGYEWIETGDSELSGYDYRQPCRCRFRDEIPKAKKEKL